MTVGELKEILDGFEDGMDVIIGMRQPYGVDFAVEVAGVDVQDVSAFGGERCKALVITRGQQIGAVEYQEN